MEERFKAQNHQNPTFNSLGSSLVKFCPTILFTFVLCRIKHCLLDKFYKMRFGLTQETNLAKSQTLAIIQLSDEIKLFMKEKNYGEDVMGILVGVITMPPEVESFFKVRRPRYTDFQIIKDGIGNPVEISKNLSWDVKPDYELVKDLEGVALQSVVAHAIMASVNSLKLPKKIRAFNLGNFAKDLEVFLKTFGLYQNVT